MSAQEKLTHSQKLSVANKGQIPYCKGKYVYNNGKEQRYILKEDIKEYEDAG